MATKLTQTAIPYLFMRGGTSRGPYFKRTDLPEDLETLAQVLIAATGSGHSLNIDGIGGGNAVTTKVAMLSVSDDEWADIDYFFAQVSVEEQLVDFKPTCGNMLSAVGPAAIEMGLIDGIEPITEIKIRAVNTGARVKARVRTSHGAVVYCGDTAIDGVPGTAAPVELTFLDVAGGATGAFLPTGNLRDLIDGVEVTCMDVAMPCAIARAEDLGITGYETVEELDKNSEFFARFEAIRIKAGELMGLGDVKESVVPKFAVLAPASKGGTIATRYFMPWKTHPTMAVTGGQCIAACALTPGSIADGMLTRPSTSPSNVTLEHPSGSMDVLVEFNNNGGFEFEAAGLVRTARKLADGNIFVPATIWEP